ncbi:unnamed protein product [Diamesa serratosioi]
MSAKFIVFFALVAVASAGVIVKQIVNAEAPANYDFNYAIDEALTGDVHSQHETAENGVIHGSYRLNDADGFLRVVEYTADDVNGFQANVRREPMNVKVVHKVIQKVIAQPQAGPWY